MDGYSGAGVLRNEKAKPWPRSHQPRSPHYLCSERDQGFTKPKPCPSLRPGKTQLIPGPFWGQGPETLAPLQPSKTPHYPCSERGRGFTKTLAPLQPAKTSPLSML